MTQQTTHLFYHRIEFVCSETQKAYQQKGGSQTTASSLTSGHLPKCYSTRPTEL